MLPPEEYSLSAHTCEVCTAVTLHWILWQNARGHQRYFCDNDCLAHWIAQQYINVGREVRLECEHL
jgi:hypothetical protein